MDLGSERVKRAAGADSEASAHFLPLCSEFMNSIFWFKLDDFYPGLLLTSLIPSARAIQYSKFQLVRNCGDIHN